MFMLFLIQPEMKCSTVTIVEVDSRSYLHCEKITEVISGCIFMKLKY